MVPEVNRNRDAMAGLPARINELGHVHTTQGVVNEGEGDDPR